jgi:hypothetical protein
LAPGVHDQLAGLNRGLGAGTAAPRRPPGRA